MHPLVDFCEKFNLGKRVVEVFLEVELSSCEEEGSFQQEYESLGYENPKHFIENLYQQDRGENTAILDILVEIYQKVARIEKRLNHSKDSLLPLGSKDTIKAMGHEILWLEKGGLSEGKKYYLRLVLPSFSDKIIAFFAQALSQNVLRIVMMNSKDSQEFDRFIANKEMEKIRQARK